MNGRSSTFPPSPRSTRSFRYRRRTSTAVESARRFHRSASRFRFSEDLKRQLGSDAFSAQYQQTPVPPGGAMIKRDWIKRYQELPPQRERSLILQSWDTASKGGPENDLSVCTTWFISRDRRWYLIDVWRKRVDYPAAQGRRAHSRLPDMRKPGARRRRRRRDFARPRVAGRGRRDSSRSSRIATRSPACPSSRPSSNRGCVLLPERASWLADFEAELFAFPGSRHDDQCDSVSQALSDDNFKSR